MQQDLMHLDSSELGKKSDYISTYDSTLLFPIPRAIKREELGLDVNNIGFYGVDIWNHYEISWLNSKGKPMVAIGEISYPASSPNIIESKSMKLYFNSFNNTRLNDSDEFVDIVIKDLSAAVGADVQFKISEVNQLAELLYKPDNAICLDYLDISCEEYLPNSSYLKIENGEVTESIYTNLLKSNCLVTHQPDWGTLYIEYTGNKINHDGLLKYIVSLRNHNEFHEQCVEKIFNDIQKKCFPQDLTVYARYTRRGGLDINPYRSTKKDFNIFNQRVFRQ